MSFDFTDAIQENQNGQMTPSDQPIDQSQVKNNAGGYVYEVDKWEKLERFLVMGSTEGTYYASGAEASKKHFQTIDGCLEEDGRRFVDKVVEVSANRVAPSNSQAILCLITALNDGDLETRRYAAERFSSVVRIGTHLFEAADYKRSMGGFGRVTSRAFSSYYDEKDHDYLAYHLVKYRQRNGWTHRDVLRLVHPETDDPVVEKMYDYVTSEWDEIGFPDLEDAEEGLDKIAAFEEAKRLDHSNSGDRSRMIELINDYGLPRECMPKPFLNHADIWEALLHSGGRGMPIHALIRNLAKMTDVGILDDFSEETALVCNQLQDTDRILGAGVHPISILKALKTYQSGGSVGRGSLSYSPVQKVVDSLDAAFYESFGNVDSAGLNTLVALDVSSSMTWADNAMYPLTAAEIAGAMALVTVSVEPSVKVMGFSDGFKDLRISPNQRLDDVVSRMDEMAFGATDCSLPAKYARQNSLDVDAILIYTDMETGSARNSGHPVEHLNRLREESGRDVKQAVIATESNGFSIADPNDPDQLDVVGFSTRTPKLLSWFLSQ